VPEKSILREFIGGSTLEPFRFWPSSYPCRSSSTWPKTLGMNLMPRGSDKVRDIESESSADHDLLLVAVRRIREEKLF
jgi:hypothetical protein